MLAQQDSQFYDMWPHPMHILELVDRQPNPSHSEKKTKKKGENEQGCCDLPPWSGFPPVPDISRVICFPSWKKRKMKKKSCWCVLFKVTDPCWCFIGPLIWNAFMLVFVVVVCCCCWMLCTLTVDFVQSRIIIDCYAWDMWCTTSLAWMKRNLNNSDLNSTLLLLKLYWVSQSKLL